MGGCHPPYHRPTGYSAPAGTSASVSEPPACTRTSHKSALPNSPAWTGSPSTASSRDTPRLLWTTSSALLQRSEFPRENSCEPVPAARTHTGGGSDGRCRGDGGLCVRDVCESEGQPDTYTHAEDEEAAAEFTYAVVRSARHRSLRVQYLLCTWIVTAGLDPRSTWWVSNSSPAVIGLVHLSQVIPRPPRRGCAGVGSVGRGCARAGLPSASRRRDRPPMRSGRGR